MVNLMSDNNSSMIDKHGLSTVVNDLVFATNTTAIHSKATFWTVVDRQSDWYKLRLPTNRWLADTVNELAPLHFVSKQGQTIESTQQINGEHNRPVYVA
jgi:hypothetical protein